MACMTRMHCECAKRGWFLDPMRKRRMNGFTSASPVNRATLAARFLTKMVTLYRSWKVGKNGGIRNMKKLFVATLGKDTNLKFVKSTCLSNRERQAGVPECSTRDLNEEA